MGEIVQFSRSRDSQPSRTKAELDIERAQYIRAAIRAREPLSPFDQVKAAENLWELVQEGKDRYGLRSADLAKEAGLGGKDGAGGKPLDTYTLPKDLADDERPRRVARLAKKAKGYGDLAEAYARLTKLGEQDILYRVFAGCDFGTARRFGQSDWDAESWDNLRTLLTRAADRVIRKAKLAEYWRDVYQVPGHYDIRQDRIDGAPFPLDQGGSQPLAQNTICSDEVPPIPSIALTRCLQSPPTGGTVRLGDKEHRTAIFLLWREVRLALGPVRALDNIGPLLEFRSVLEAKIDGQSVTFDNPFTDGSDLITQAIIDGNTIAVEVDMLDTPPCAEPQIEHSYFGRFEVTPATLRDAFTASPHDVPRDFWGSISNRDEDTALRDRASSWFVSTHPAYFIETSLHSGSFERELLARCEYLKGLVSARKGDAAAAARNAAAHTLARWQADDHAPDDQ
jgi:hypothetical protein